MVHRIGSNCCFVLLVGLLTLSSVQAESPSSKSFYKKGFVTGRSYDEQDTKAQESGQASQKAAKKPEKLPRVKELGVAGLERGIPIRRISAILNGLDSEHYWAKFNELTSVSFESDVPIGTVYKIGAHSYNPKHQEAHKRLWIMEGRTELVLAAPKRYKVTQSPTWIVETKAGHEILLEGVGSLRRFVNERGEFVQKGFAVGQKEIPVAKEKKVEKAESAAKKSRAL